MLQHLAVKPRLVNHGGETCVLKTYDKEIVAIFLLLTFKENFKIIRI